MRFFVTCFKYLAVWRLNASTRAFLSSNLLWELVLWILHYILFLIKTNQAVIAFVFISYEISIIILNYVCYLVFKLFQLFIFHDQHIYCQHLAYIQVKLTLLKFSFLFILQIATTHFMLATLSFLFITAYNAEAFTTSRLRTFRWDHQLGIGGMNSRNLNFVI